MGGVEGDGESAETEEGEEGVWKEENGVEGGVSGVDGAELAGDFLALINKEMSQ